VFIDEVVIEVASGKGGDGVASFRQEKHVPRGGPDGGDGGKGGSVTAQASAKVNTLIEYRYATVFKAEDGSSGRGAKRHGADGKSVNLVVPVGTRILDDASGKLLKDLLSDGESVIVCAGGRGGKGNVHFTTSVRQAPTFAERGEPGEAKRIRLELSLIADVGLVGLPNAGKSTLISAVSAAKPKIADYPFTTLAPNLGIVRVGHDSFVMADLPGLIEGASEGKGLGQRFLRHAERTRVIVHVVECAPVDESSPIENFRLIREELSKYGGNLSEKPFVVALSKTDLLPAGDVEPIARALSEEGEVFPISAATGSGLDPLLYRLLAAVQAAPREAPVPILSPEPVAFGPAWEISRSVAGFAIEGAGVERMVAMTDLGNSEALQYLHRRLKKSGVLDALAEEGARDGDTVTVGSYVFTYVEEG
jgi:GTP-binding protein